jgi:hypothetical protein
MTTFIIRQESCTIGFNNHVTLNPLISVPVQLNRRQLFHRKSGSDGSSFKIQKIIEDNISLRIDFGWSFESEEIYKTIMSECICAIAPKYNTSINLISDKRCSWLGFSPFNVFEKIVYENLDTYHLILFNNEIVSFQEDIVNYIANHKIYKQHSLIRDVRYRFDYLKSVRKDKDALEDIYWQYIDAIKETVQLTEIPRDIIEEDLGCHFLHYPTLFFELIAFTKLKGELYEN